MAVKRGGLGKGLDSLIPDMNIGSTASPTYTQITGTLAEQLEYVYQLLKSYKGVTNISQVNNDLPFELDVQAIENME